MPEESGKSPEQQFSDACGLFELGLLNAINVLEENKQWFSAALLCAVAVDVLADATMRHDAQGEDYIAFIRQNEALREYGAHAERFYAVLRCGLAHRMQLSDIKNGSVAMLRAAC